MAHGPFLRRLLDGQVDLLREGLVVGEDRLVFRRLFDLPVQALDRIRRIDECPDLRGILEEGCDLVPVRPPGGGDMGITLVPFFLETVS